MRKRSERSLVLFALIFVFACLLLTGGERLIGHEGEENPAPARSVSTVSAALCAMPAPVAQSGHVPARETDGQRMVITRAEEGSLPRSFVLSDANGNVISCGTYMHAVYQAFTLGDGFV